MATDLDLNPQPADTPAETPSPSPTSDFNLDAAVDSIADGLGFKKTGEEPKPEEQPPAPAEPEKPEETPAPAPTGKAAPQSWRKEVAEKFATLDPAVQDEILRREEDFHRGIEGYKRDATFGRTVSQVIEPYLPILQAANINPVAAINNLLEVHVALSKGTPEQKYQLLQNIATSYGITAPGEAPFEDPAVRALREELSGVKSQLTARTQAEEQAIRAQLAKDIDSFAKDPKNIYFEELQDDIAQLLRSGVAADLPSAYEKAIWLNPVVRGKEQARIAAEQQKTLEQQRKQKAEDVRRSTAANVSLRQKPATSSTAPAGSMEDTMKEILAAIRSR